MKARRCGRQLDQQARLRGSRKVTADECIVAEALASAFCTPSLAAALRSFLHSFLWPSSQCFVWQAAPQYHICLHPAQRCRTRLPKLLLLHPGLLHVMQAVEVGESCVAGAYAASRSAVSTASCNLRDASGLSPVVIERSFSKSLRFWAAKLGLAARVGS